MTPAIMLMMDTIKAVHSEVFTSLSVAFSVRTVTTESVWTHVKRSLGIQSVALQWLMAIHKRSLNRWQLAHRQRQEHGSHSLEGHIAEQVLRSLATRGYRLHAFGVKVLGLERYADAIVSSDSMAWSVRGRHVPGCSPSHRSESNCLRFALRWHQNLITTLASKQPHQPDRVTSVARVAA